MKQDRFTTCQEPVEQFIGFCHTFKRGIKKQFLDKKKIKTNVTEIESKMNLSEKWFENSKKRISTCFHVCKHLQFGQKTQLIGDLL